MKRIVITVLLLLAGCVSHRQSYLQEHTMSEETRLDIQEGRIAVGMSPSEVFAAFDGTPYTKSLTYSGGHVTEIWLIPGSHRFPLRWSLVFHDGRLASWTEY